METFKSILFPVDFSERCEAARPVVASWARKFNAKVTLLHTIQIPISSYGGPDGYPIIVDVPGIEASAYQRLQRFEIDIPGTARVVRIGDPGYEIVQYAEKNHIDLIMMPTHGYGKFRSLLLGSSAAKVLHDAHCPVWTSAHLEQIPLEARTEMHNILFALEVGPESVKELQSADELARAWGARLRLVHAVPVDETRPEKYLEGDFRAALIQMGNEQLADIQGVAGTKLEVRVEGGEVSHVVRDVVREYNADLVITGRGKLHQTFGRLRTNTYAIVRDAPCPVLSM